MTTMPLYVNIFRPTTSRLLTSVCSSKLNQKFIKTRQICMSTQGLPKTPCKTLDISASKIVTIGYQMTPQNILIPSYCLPTKRFSTSSKRPGMSPGEMKRELQSDSGMYGVNIQGRTYDIRNTPKLVTSFPYLPVHTMKRLWLLHIFPRYYLGEIDTSFSANEFMGGADDAVEPILEAAGSGYFEELYNFMDEKIVEEMMSNRPHVNTELLNMLTQEVIWDMAFQNERSLCNCNIEKQNATGSTQVSITGVLRGDAQISTEMGQYLYEKVSPPRIRRPHEIPMNINLHFLFRCTREYSYDGPHRDWVINGFTFTIDVPDLFIAYIL